MLYSLSEICASGGQMPVITLTFENAKFKNPYRYVLGYSDVTIGDNFFAASAFTIQLPERSDSGFSDLSFAICNVSGEAYEMTKKAIESLAPTYLTLQEWAPDDYSLMQSLRLTVTDAKITTEQATFVASFCDMLNTAFPRLRYTDKNAPGLKYIA